MPAHVREKVREKALALFAQKGVKSTTIKELAGAAGVSEGALYRHWASKEDLASELFAAEYADIATTLETAAEAGPAPHRLRRVFRAAFARFESDPYSARFLLISQHEALPLVPEGTRTPVDAVYEIVAQGVAEGSLRSMDVDAVAHVVIGAIVMNVQSRVYGRQKTPLTELSDTISDAVLNGVASEDLR